MKPLANYILIFDKDCPLCTAYTGLFVKYGFLAEQGRQAYQDMDFINTNIDTELARNKIALFNTETKQSIYGIDAMTKVLENKFPFISFCMRFKPLYWLMTQLYSLISFNRKIIIPVSCKNLTSCNPTKSWFWRSLFILICFIPFQLIIPVYTAHFTGGNYFQPSFPALLFFGQIIFQLIVCLLAKEKNMYDYTGHISFISFIAAIILALCHPALKTLETIGIISVVPGIVCLLLVSVWMLLEHHRRMKILGMSTWLTISWMLFQLLVYILTLAF